MSDALDKKTVEELKKMIEDQDIRIEGLEGRLKKNERSRTKSDGDSDVSAFSLKPTENLTNVAKIFTDAAEALKNQANIFNEDIFQELDEYATSVQSTFGLSKSRISEFRSVIAETAPELIKMGLSAGDASASIVEAMDGLNSSASLSSKTII